MTLEVLKSVLTGAIAGFASGLLGVSPGGILVAVISLMLGFPQHLAQAVSLASQVPPTSLSGISNYARAGRKIPLAWAAFVSLGFLGGSPAGAALTRFVDDRQLRWMFVAYLLLLALISALRSPGRKMSGVEFDVKQASRASLVFIGIIAGISSGLLGIGGGLAITTLSLWLIRASRHQAQALSLIVTALPLTLPAAWMYTRQGLRLPWWSIGGIVVGLAAGSKTGAILANKLSERTLRLALVILILAMAAYMMASAGVIQR